MAADCWKGSKLLLVSNGWFLDRHPDLPEVLAAYKVRLDISVHHHSQAYTEKVNQIRELLDGWQQRHPFELNFRQSDRNWRRWYNTRDDGKPEPIGSEKPEDAWCNCPAKRCAQLYQGKIWKCPQVAYFHQLDEKLRLRDVPGWEKFREYRPLEPTATRDEIRKFVERRTETICSTCPAKAVTFELRDPRLSPAKAM